MRPSLHEAEHTPLMMAASAGNTSCCQALMQYNPDQQLAATSRDYCLALHLSDMHGHVETAALILNHNPRPQLLKLSTGQKAPLHYAVRSGSVACVRLLLEHHPQEPVELIDVEGQVRKKEGMPAFLCDMGFGLGSSADGAGKEECFTVLWGAPFPCPKVARLPGTKRCLTVLGDAAEAHRTPAPHGQVLYSFGGRCRGA